LIVCNWHLMDKQGVVPTFLSNALTRSPSTANVTISNLK
jgi:hypothetical protein